jgi:hypothetical protein
MQRPFAAFSDRLLPNGQRKWLVPLAAFGLTLFAPLLFGSPIPLCTSGTVASYVGSTCSIDGYTLEDFTFSDSSTGGAPLLDPSVITVDPSVNSSGISFQFLGDFNVPSGTAEYIIQYELDPQLPQVNGIDIDLGPSDPVTLTGQFCGNGTFAGSYVAGQLTSCTGTDPSGIFPVTLQTTGNNTSAGASFPVLVTDLDSRLVLDLDGPASVTSFGSNVGISSVPEPSTSLLLAPGMLGLLWLRKRFLTTNR